MRGLRLVFALVLVATVAMAGCPEGGEDGGGYVRTGDTDAGLDPDPEPAGAQDSPVSDPKTSTFVPGSTNT